MKKIIFILLITCVMCAGAFAQDSIFVSAKGDNANSGLSETESVKTLAKALETATARNINKITVIGTLDINSEGVAGDNGVFYIKNISREILISGKPDASRSERAVLSGRGSKKAVVMVENSRARFENIEISRSDGGDKIGDGLFIYSKSQVTVGQGVSIQNNQRMGIFIHEAQCTIDGGEIKNNSMCGVMVTEKSTLTLQSGVIKDNRTQLGGGVIVMDGGNFSMVNGNISGNSSRLPGSGVYVRTGGTFNQTGGTILNNQSESRISNHNVHREEGTFGSNL